MSGLGPVPNKKRRLNNNNSEYIHHHQPTDAISDETHEQIYNELYHRRAQKQYTLTIYKYGARNKFVGTHRTKIKFTNILNAVLVKKDCQNALKQHLMPTNMDLYLVKHSYYDDDSGDTILDYDLGPISEIDWNNPNLRFILIQQKKEEIVKPVQSNANNNSQNDKQENNKKSRDAEQRLYDYVNKEIDPILWTLITSEPGIKKHMILKHAFSTVSIDECVSFAITELHRKGKAANFKEISAAKTAMSTANDYNKMKNEIVNETKKIINNILHEKEQKESVQITSLKHEINETKSLLKDIKNSINNNNNNNNNNNDNVMSEMISMWKLQYMQRMMEQTIPGATRSPSMYKQRQLSLPDITSPQIQQQPNPNIQPKPAFLNNIPNFSINNDKQNKQ